MKNLMMFLSESNKIEGVYDDKALVKARKAWDYLIQQPELTYENIMQTHRILMRGLLKPDWVGTRRKIKVWVGNRECPNPGQVNRMLFMWLATANDKKSEEQIKEDHIRFEHIHPFVDGNGRIGRIIMNWQRVKSGHDIQVIYDSQKMFYYAWFRRREVII